MCARCRIRSCSNVETLYHILDSRAEALEFVIREGVGSDGHSADEFESQEQPADRMHQPQRQYQDRAWTGLHTSRAIQ